MKKVKKSLLFVLAVFLLVSFCHPLMASSGKINITTAPKVQFLQLKGVGDKIADRIIEYRKDHPFIKIEDLMNVKGIGQKVFDKNKDMLTVEDE